MYACVLEIGRGFFEGVCTPCHVTAYFYAPPPHHLAYTASRRKRKAGVPFLARDPGSLRGCY